MRRTSPTGSLAASASCRVAPSEPSTPGSPRSRARPSGRPPPGDSSWPAPPLPRRPSWSTGDSVQPPDSLARHPCSARFGCRCRRRCWGAGGARARPQPVLGRDDDRAAARRRGPWYRRGTGRGWGAARLRRRGRGGWGRRGGLVGRHRHVDRPLDHPLDDPLHRHERRDLLRHSPDLDARRPHADQGPEPGKEDAEEEQQPEESQPRRQDRPRRGEPAQVGTRRAACFLHRHGAPGAHEWSTIAPVGSGMV